MRRNYTNFPPSRREFLQTLGVVGAAHLASPALLSESSAEATNPDPTIVLYPAAQAFVDKLAKAGGPPLYTMTPAAAREVLENLQAGPVDKPVARTEDRMLPVGPGGQVSVRIYRPEGASGNLPTVVYMHGGGWILGSVDTHDRLLRDLTNASELAFVFVNYSRSPEAHYPTAIEQGYAVAKYVAEHGSELGLDGRRLAVAGDSVGGNMTAAITLLAKERGGPKLTFQAMMYPVTDANFETGSYKEFANGPWLTRRAMEWFWDAYLPNKAERARITASPLRATVDQLTGLPPALLLVDVNDVLRDEGEAYGLKLVQAGVHVTVQRYLGVFHDFAMLNALADLPGTETAIQTAAKSLAWGMA